MRAKGKTVEAATAGHMTRVGFDRVGLDFFLKNAKRSPQLPAFSGASVGEETGGSKRNTLWRNSREHRDRRDA